MQLKQQVEERLQKKHTHKYKNKIQIAKRELNKVSKAVMCEVMLDIQMIVPTGRPMGDGGGSESSLFSESLYRSRKRQTCDICSVQWLASEGPE